MELNDLLQRLDVDTKARRLRLVAQGSGIPYYTLRNLRSRAANPRYTTLEKLRAYYAAEQKAAA